MKKIIFIAAPAAGKGTQSEMLCQKYHLAHISTGSLLREELAKNSEIGKMIATEYAEGKLIEDSILMKLLNDRLSKSDCENGYIIDGFPRTLNQAIMFDKMDSSGKTYVFYLDVSKELAKNRILGRLTCPNCDRVYNDRILESNPKVAGICDDCHVALVRRSDDTEESFSNRYAIYESSTLPLKEHYQKLGILYHVNSNLDKESVFKQIERYLNDSY